MGYSLSSLKLIHCFSLKTTIGSCSWERGFPCWIITFACSWEKILLSPGVIFTMWEGFASKKLTKRRMKSFIIITFGMINREYFYCDLYLYRPFECHAGQTKFRLGLLIQWSICTNSQPVYDYWDGNKRFHIYMYFYLWFFVSMNINR